MNRPITERQTNQLRRRLKNRRAELLRAIREELLKSEHERYIDLADRVHDVGDESVAALISEIDLAVIDHHVHELQDVEAAQWRMSTGAFGKCIDCAESIEYKRLSAYPTAKRCYTCQKRYEETHARRL
ncbi:MAG: TraR/DksA family transcriptional regulator [Gammaproteobacteria bacterium]